MHGIIELGQVNGREIYLGNPEAGHSQVTTLTVKNLIKIPTRPSDSSEASQRCYYGGAEQKMTVVY